MAFSFFRKKSGLRCDRIIVARKLSCHLYCTVERPSWFMHSDSCTRSVQIKTRLRFSEIKSTWLVVCNWTVLGRLPRLKSLALALNRVATLTADISSQLEAKPQRMQANFVVYRISPLVLWFDVYYLMRTHPRDTPRGGLWITYQISMTCLQKLHQRRCHLSVRPSHCHYRVLMLLLLLVSMVHPVHYCWLVVYRVDQLYAGRNVVWVNKYYNTE